MLQENLMTEIIETLTMLSLLVFVIGSMASMGLSLKIKQILEPLKNIKLVVLALVVNFVLVPIAGYVIILFLPMNESLKIGLILTATAAGAPFLPKLAEIAKGNVAFSVGLMVLLMIATTIYLPFMLPLLLQGVEVSPWDIAQSLIVMMLLPLAIGLFVNARYEEVAAKVQPTLGQDSNTALLVLIVLGVVLNFKSMIGLVGSNGILAGVLTWQSVISWVARRVLSRAGWAWGQGSTISRPLWLWPGRTSEWIWSLT
jgi:predicted Na+-dependent transporter